MANKALHVYGGDEEGKRRLEAMTDNRFYLPGIAIASGLLLNATASLMRTPRGTHACAVGSARRAIVYLCDQNGRPISAIGTPAADRTTTDRLAGAGPSERPAPVVLSYPATGPAEQGNRI